MLLDRPSSQARGYETVTGTLEFAVEAAVSSVDLGVLVPGDKSSSEEFTAAIEKTRDEVNDEVFDITLKMVLPRHRVKTVRFLDASGRELESELRHAGDRPGPYKYSVTYRLSVNSPENTRVSVDLYESGNEVVIPFQLKNLDLFGRPRS